MTEYLFVGGPLDGQMCGVQQPRPIITVAVPRCDSIRFVPVDIPVDPTFRSVEYVQDCLGTLHYGIGFYAIADMDPADVFEKVLTAVCANRHRFTRVEVTHD